MKGVALDERGLGAQGEGYAVLAGSQDLVAGDLAGLSLLQGDASLFAFSNCVGGDIAGSALLCDGYALVKSLADRVFADGDVFRADRHMNAVDCGLELCLGGSGDIVAGDLAVLDIGRPDAVAAADDLVAGYGHPVQGVGALRDISALVRIGLLLCDLGPVDQDAHLLIIGQRVILVAEADRIAGDADLHVLCRCPVTAGYAGLHSSSFCEIAGEKCSARVILAASGIYGQDGDAAGAARDRVAGYVHVLPVCPLDGSALVVLEDIVCDIDVCKGGIENAGVASDASGHIDKAAAADVYIFHGNCLDPVCLKMLLGQDIQLDCLIELL